jgi:dihydroorotase
MNLFINNILWINPGDPESGKNTSIRIKDCLVSEFGEDIKPKEEEQIIDGSGYCCSPGWIDLICRNGAPGRPQNESLDSLANASAAGGFTKIMLQPDTKPIIDTIESVSFFKNFGTINGVNFLVSAAATQNLEGNKMAEILRLNKQGADSFSLVQSLTDSGFFGRLLQYIQHSEKVLIDQPSDYFLSKNGQINEGLVSDRRGLPGVPEEAELIVVDRNIKMLKYAGGKLHLSCLSTSESIEKIDEAKNSGLTISCSIAANQLAFNDEELDQFDTLHKVWPPYRTEENRNKIIKALQEGKIDAVVSNHSPWHYDFKDIEFENAEFGISSLETTFCSLVHFGEITDPAAIVQLLYSGPSKILDRKIEMLKPGTKADFTLFSVEGISSFEKNTWQSKSKNSPFLGKNLKGRILGIITENGFFGNGHAGSKN